MILKKVYLPEPPSIGRTMNVKPRRRKKRKGGGFSWSSYWKTLISATVENAAPTYVVLTFPSGQPSLLATDITATVNGVARGVSSALWAGGHDASPCRDRRFCHNGGEPVAPGELLRLLLCLEIR